MPCQPEYEDSWRLIETPLDNSLPHNFCRITPIHCRMLATHAPCSTVDHHRDLTQHAAALFQRQAHVWHQQVPFQHHNLGQQLGLATDCVEQARVQDPAWGNISITNVDLPCRVTTGQEDVGLKALACRPPTVSGKVGEGELNAAYYRPSRAAAVERYTWGMPVHSLEVFPLKGD